MKQIAKTTNKPLTVAQLKERLAERPTKEEIGAILAPIFTAFQTSANGDNAAAKVAVYALAIEDIAPWATRQAVKDFIKGNVPSHDGRFMPSSAQLAKRAREIRDLKSSTEYKRIASVQPVEPEPKPMTEQERKRRAAQVKALMAGIGG